MAVLGSTVTVRKAESHGLCAWRQVGQCLLSGLLLLLTATGEAAPVGEHQVKAAMAYNVTKYVEWPGDVNLAPAAFLNLCLIGKGGMGTALAAIHGLETRGKKISVKQLAKSDDSSACHVLVIGDMEKRYLLGILESSADKEILTVSDLPRFAATGGMVGLVAEGGRVKFEINLAATKRAKLKISSQLLKLARIVHGEER